VKKKHVIKQLLLKNVFFFTLWSFCKRKYTQTLPFSGKFTIFAAAKRAKSMSSKFLQMIDSAQESKREFDLSVVYLKDSLHESVVTAQSRAQQVSFDSNKVQTTGWLRGSLSYPWVVVCTIIPAVMEMIV
jgi:hypothetical protein